MSIKTMTWAFDQPLSGNEKVVLRSKIYASSKIEAAMIAANLSAVQRESFVAAIHSKKEKAPPVLSNGKRVTRGIHNGTRQRVYREHGYACAACGSTKEITIDHIVPLAKGGRNCYENLQVLCSSCNVSKGTFFNDEWVKK